MINSLTFATGNPNKVEEARKLLPELEILQYEADLVEVKSDSLREIAITSLESLPIDVEKPVFVEDSGIFIQGLNGFPGPISGYVNATLGNQRILQLLEDIDDRSAYFESVIALQIPEGDIVTFAGRLNGRIAKEERGEYGFDYDSIFTPEGSQKTLAEMTTNEKNEFSHRGKALMNLKAYLLGN